MNVENNNENIWKIDNKKLLDELSIDIANKFWLDKEKAKKLIKKETLSWIDSLKSELEKGNNTEGKLTHKEVEKLFFILKWALDVIENSSKIEIKSLKNEIDWNIEETINIEKFENKIEDYLPKKLIEIAKNPTKPHEHILGFALWTTNSIYITVDILYKIWKWLLQSPYHLYIIMSWKWEVESFKNI